MPDRPRQVPVENGERRELAIETLADGPDALARVGDYVVLVPGCLPGERVLAEITSSARKFGRARLLAVRQPSADRDTPRCAHFLHCGGCHWQHVRYARQLREKQARVQKELAHALGEQAPPVLETAPAPAPYGQRHKVALQLGNDERGRLQPCLHPLRSAGLLPVRECPASAPAAAALAFAATRLLDRLQVGAFDPVRGTGLLRSVLVRRSASSAESQLLVVATRPVPGLERLLPELLAAGATTVALNLNDGPAARLLGRETTVLAGPLRLRERIDGVDYAISPAAFFQTAPAGAAVLVRAVQQWLAPGPQDHVLDLYCGGGLFALALARSARSVLGIEESPLAVGDAIAGAAQNELHNVRFVQARAEQGLDRCGSGLPVPDLAVLDPPRAGAGERVLQRLAALGPRRIAHVGCEPRALARDLAVLTQLAYRAVSVLPVDLFPQTAHVEAVACLERSTR